MNNKILLIVVIVLFINVVISFRNKTNFSLDNVSVKDFEEIDVLINDKLEDYVIGVVACEMPASFSDDALKAQAISARTNAMFDSQSNLDYNWVTNVTSQCYITRDEMKSKWGNDYEKYYNKIRNDVYDTAGLVISYDNQIIKAYYYSMSNGYTEDSKYVFGTSLPYIQVVESFEDENLKNFIYKKYFLKSEFLDKLNIINDNIVISNIERDESNRIISILINNKKFTGIQIRKLLDLRSTDFEINILDSNVEVVTKGYGHGVGMSQYGANILSNMGKKYDEIINYYYKNVELLNLYV